jgi:hypothetical protein
MSSWFTRIILGFCVNAASSNANHIKGIISKVEEHSM